MSPGRKLRDLFIEGKIYFTRTVSYLNVLNFLMIALIFMNTTLWEYDLFQQVFSSRKIFIFVGLIAVLILTATIGYFDTKLKLWRTESSKSLYPERTPVMLPQAFQCAKMLADLKKQGANVMELENRLDDIFSQCNLKAEFDAFKKQTVQ